jgi:hypothetical protein
MHRPSLAAAVMLVVASLAVPAAAVAADSVTRPMSGSCITVPVLVPPSTPGALFGVTITGTCRFTHLGRTEMAAAQDVFAGPGGLSLAGGAVYTAANGDRIQTSYGGPVQVTGPVSVSFSGTETIVGGTGRFAGATGSVHYEGDAVTAPPGLPGAGRVGIDGSITY